MRVGGACPLDDRLRALVAATQEAMVNAAAPLGRAGRSRSTERSRPTRSRCSCATKGRGFDPAAIPTDRGGIAESIVGRMQRNGGVAVIRSRPGQGTEVELSMKRVPA